MSLQPGDTVWNKLKSNKFDHVTESFDQAAVHMDKRRRGIIVPYRSAWPRFNYILGGGIQPSTIYVVGGRPSVGKSAFTNRLLFDICETNDVNETIICYWSLEMPGYQQVAREISGSLGVPVQDLYSAKEPLPDSLYKEILTMRDQWKTKPIFITSRSYSPDIIYKRSNEIQNAGLTKHIVNVIDHTRLVSRNQYIRSEEQLIRETMTVCQRLSVEKGFTNILLSQLNRDIEQPHRIKEPIPLLSDFFGADAVGQFANIAIALQRPEMYDKKKYIGEDTNRLLAVHILKNRDGPVAWIPFDHELDKNRMKERHTYQTSTLNSKPDPKTMQYGF